MALYSVYETPCQNEEFVAGVHFEIISIGYFDESEIFVDISRLLSNLMVQSLSSHIHMCLNHPFGQSLRHDFISVCLITSFLFPKKNAPHFKSCLQYQLQGTRLRMNHQASPCAIFYSILKIYEWKNLCWSIKNAFHD